MENDLPVSTVLKYIGHVNRGELDQIEEMTAEDLKFTDYAGDVYFEPEFMREYLANFPDYRIHVHHTLQGGQGVAIVGQTSGSHVEPEVEKREILVWTAEVRDGLIAEWRIYRGEM